MKLKDLDRAIEACIAKAYGYRSRIGSADAQREWEATVQALQDARATALANAEITLDIEAS